MKSIGYVFKSRDYIGSAQPPATVLEDESRFGNDGAFKADSEPNWVQLPSGLWVLDFDGTDDIIDLGNPSALNPAHISVLVWAKSTTLKDQGLVTKWGAGADRAFEIHPRVDGAVTFNIYLVGDVGNGFVIDDIGYEDGAWRLYSLTWDGATLVAYIDAVNKGTDATNSGDMKTISNNVFIGKEERNARFYNGSIGKVRILNYALSAEDIAAIFQAERHWFGV